MVTKHLKEFSYLYITSQIKDLVYWSTVSWRIVLLKRNDEGSHFVKKHSDTTVLLQKYFVDC